MHDIEDNGTIVSLATPQGRGGIAIVRMSGPLSIYIAARLFSAEIPENETHRLYYGHIVDPVGGGLVDEVMLGVMRAPRSYTREDVVEINCHGGTVAASRVLSLMISQGARPAEPGEFTKRAFLNGRIDLSQAEAVLDVIEARSEEAGRLAMDQLSGRLSKRISELRSRLVGTCSELEAHLDFPEEDIEAASLRSMGDSMLSIASDIEGLLKTFEGGRLFREGLRTAIVGRPNVGKSSLLNSMVEEERAIVTEVPGTTRDIIEDFIAIKGLPLRIMDTAGIRESHDMVEQEGVRRSLKALEDADLVIAVFDGSQHMHEEDRRVLRKIGQKRAVLVLNKSDLPRMITEGGNDLLFEDAIAVSAKRGDGLDDLREAVYEAALGEQGGFEGSEGVVVTNARHKAALDRGLGFLSSAIASIDSNPLEVTAMELREAVTALGSIIGEVTSEDILNDIFARFCIGK